MYQKISDRLGPRWCHHNYHHGYCHLLWLLGLRCCQLGGGGVSCFLHNYLSPRANDSSPWLLIGSPWLLIGSPWLLISSPWCGRSLLQLLPLGYFLGFQLGHFQVGRNED